MPSLFDAELRHSKHYEAVLQQLNRFYLDGGNSLLVGLEQFHLEWGNIQTGQSWAARWAGTNADAAELCMHYPHSGAYVLDLRQAPMQHIEWLEKALNAARDLEDSMMEEIHLGNLGLVLADIGKTHQAIACHEKAIEISQAIGDRRGEANDTINLGLALTDMGNYQDAIACHARALEIMSDLELDFCICSALKIE